MPIKFSNPPASTTTISPPSLCDIFTLFPLSTLATVFVSPAALIALAILSASVAKPVAVTLTVTAAVRFASPFSVSCRNNVYVPAGTLPASTLAPNTSVAPTAALL